MASPGGPLDMEGLADLLRKARPLPEARLSMLPPFRSLEGGPEVEGQDWKPAAVLVLVYPDSKGRPVFPLIRRNATMRHHRGEYALPGGRLEAGETDLEAALRETREELGLDRKYLEALGPPLALSPLPIPPSGFRIQPFIACGEKGPRVRIETSEVEAWFEVPLAYLLEARRRTHRTQLWKGQEWAVPYFDFGEPQVWGATALVLAEVAAIIEQAL